MANQSKRRNAAFATNPNSSKDRPVVRKLGSTSTSSTKGPLNLWRLLVGRPLRTSESAKERINPIEGLSALSLDALTSVAYGPEALLSVLAVGGATALNAMVPITIVIVILLAVLVTSYRQVIEAYPTGGGAYAVSKANLGRNVSLLAAASLVVDYTLTVAVSIAAGVSALTSAFPALAPQTVPLCLVVLAILTLMNLRGLGETARVFLLPTALFIFGIYVVIVLGLVHPLALSARNSTFHIPSKSSQTLGILLILKAFSAGCSALTGVEAIANGVPLYKEPRVTRAKKTEMLLGLILGSMLIGLASLASRFHIFPNAHQTVLSQIMVIALGRNFAFISLSLVVTLVLALAANTSFGGLPILASLLAQDNFLPHRFALRGDRQVFSAGIWTLAFFSALLLVGVNGNTNNLIPMFAIGVFTGFTPCANRVSDPLEADQAESMEISSGDQCLWCSGNRDLYLDLPLHQVPKWRVDRSYRGPVGHSAFFTHQQLLPKSRYNPASRHNAIQTEIPKNNGDSSYFANLETYPIRDR